MKIIRLPALPIRRDRAKIQVNIPTVTTPLESVAEKPKKRALLIGVQGSEGALKGPHRDVAVMKDLLIDNYGYLPKDIVTLVDTKDAKQKQPTHDNMIEEMMNLVKDAVAGDRFFFHYAGHATQEQNKDNKEEDGMDECIIPCDGKLIKDDVLRTILVDSLPPKSHLVAIFDSCHSASLLDLKHFRCNRVYVPWISKGRRRSDSKWYANVRRNAALVNRTIHQTSRMSNNIVKTRKTSIDHLSEQPRPPLPPTPASHLVEFTAEHSRSTSSSSTTSSSSLPAPQSPATRALRAISLDKNQKQRTGSVTKDRRRQSTSTIKSSYTPWFDDRPGQEGLFVCESPVAEFCTGECRSYPSPITSRRPTFGSGKSALVRRPLADVISLGSCKDSQFAWEDLSGASMTQALAEILSADPHPTLNDFMTKLSHTLHDRLMRMHEANMQYKKKKKWWRKIKGRKAPPEGDTKGELEINNFQDPQISSHKPLNMESRLEF
ncbi:hypothetical protein E1B28_005410 [Marasmius oreades]|uniref:Peptidase C14 caspase domain-containing protein n=1 Tax=Marasmius oreades TaxID=181124 RepID=A0A9P7S335_9AGAR|nr:uncharacterized protein E1B28_005410 [Marasmius oreades]KAG7094584.1 hypothetical protein E1B28_005410 [Marasmius oreades]